MELSLLLLVNGGMVEGLKRLFGISGIGVNLVSIIGGVGLVAAVSYMNGTPIDASLIPGVVTGLSTTGGYELLKRFVNGLLNSVVGE